MTTDQRDIKRQRDALRERAAAHRAEGVRIEAEWGVLKELCPHPNATRVTHMGDPCLHCFDCGLCDVHPRTDS